MTTDLRDLLLVFEWLLHRGACPVDEACARFGLRRDEFESLIDTLAFVGDAPASPNDLLSAYIDDETDLVHVEPFPGLSEGVSMDLDVARTLYAATDALARLPGFEDATATRAAAERLGAALDAAGVDVKALRTDFDVPGATFVAPLQRAILRHERVRLSYRAATATRTSERLVDPVGLYGQRGVWYLDAFDHRRQARVSFRLDRIEDLEVTATRFDPADAEASSAPESPKPEMHDVRLRCAPEAAWIAERLSSATIDRDDDGGVRIVLRAEGLSWLVPLCLAAGPAVAIEAPAALRELVGAAAAAARSRY